MKTMTTTQAHVLSQIAHTMGGAPEHKIAAEAHRFVARRLVRTYPVEAKSGRDNDIKRRIEMHMRAAALHEVAALECA